MKKPPISSVQLSGAMATPAPDSNPAGGSVPPLPNPLEDASSSRLKLVLVDNEKGSFDLFVDLGQAIADELRPEGVRASIPLRYLPLPPKPNPAVPSPATVSVQPGLVHLLNTYPGHLPSTSDVPTELAQRLCIEVADHLDCRRQVEVPLADVNEQWLASFQRYLETFYVPERVAQYLTAVRLLVTRYGCDTENSKS